MNSTDISMNTEKVKQLLEKYYDGQTTADEESLLKEFFGSRTVPDELKSDREIFKYFIMSSGIPEPGTGFEKRIIDNVGKAERRSSGSRISNVYRFVSGIAAGVIIVAGLYFLFTERQEPSDTYSDPETAYNEAMKILCNVSGRMRHGTRELEKIGMMQKAADESFQVLGEPAAIVREKMKPLGHLNKTYKLLSHD